MVVWNWLMSHELVLGGFLGALLDLIFALNPSWAANGVLHFIWLQAKKLGGSPPPAA